MFCSNCGKKLEKGTRVCPYCNANLEDDFNSSYRAPLFSPKKPKEPKRKPIKKPNLWISVVSLILAILMIVPLIFTTVLAFNQNEPAASDAKIESKVKSTTEGETGYDSSKIEKQDPDSTTFNGISPDPDGANILQGEIKVVEDAINTAERIVKQEHPTVTSETLKIYLDAVRDELEKLYDEDLIDSFRANLENIDIKLNCGVHYFYAPKIEEIDAGDVPEVTVATFQPYFTSGQYEKVPHVKNYIDDGARAIADAFEPYVFNIDGSYDSDLNDSEVTVESCVKFGKHNVVLWHGHGTYSNDYGPLMTLGVKRTKETDEKYYALLKSNKMYVSSSSYFIGGDFIDSFVPDNSLDKTVFYLGTCSSGYSSKLADALLNKGAAAVYAVDKSVLTTYNASMAKTISEGLTKQNADGSYYNVEQALTYAQNINGKTDNGPNNAAVKLFTNNKTFSLDWYMDHVIVERDIVLALDVSGSMNGTPLEETKNAAIEFVNTVLDDNARIGVVTYDSDVTTVCDLSTRKQYLTDNITALQAGGSTNIDGALQKAEQMLDESNARKKIIVLMSDGEPNVGRVGDQLVNYANSIKDKGIYIYTLGFFSSLSGGNLTQAQKLLEEIATEGHHYEVKNAEDLVYFFGDMADTISGQKFIYIRIACPVDVKVTKDGETLNSSEKNLNTRSSFGSLSFENASEDGDSGDVEGKADNVVKILRLKDGMEYDIEISGNGKGKMDYEIRYMDEKGDYTDKREFNNIPITRSTEIDTVASSQRKETVMKLDSDGDGKYDKLYKADSNSEGVEYKNPMDILIILYLIDILWIAISVLLMVFQIKRLKRFKESVSA